MSNRRIITVEEAQTWKEHYESDPDQTIESLALEYGVTLNTMRIWLNKVDTQMRPPSSRGKRHRSPRNNTVDGIKGKSEGKSVPYRKANARGHRRRARGF
jgi:transposase-like protein